MVWSFNVSSFILRTQFQLYNWCGPFFPDTMEPIKPRALGSFDQIISSGIDSVVMYPSGVQSLRSSFTFLKLKFSIKTLVIFYPALLGIFLLEGFFRKPNSLSPTHSPPPSPLRFLCSFHSLFKSYIKISLLSEAFLNHSS